MSTVQRIAKNASLLLISRALSYLLAFFYTMYAARYLGAAGFGVLSFALAFAVILGIFADVGLHPLTVREVARDKSLASKYLANISVMKIVLAFVTFGLIALVINLMGYPQQTIIVVYLVGLSVIFMSFTQMFYSIFQAFERMEYQSLGRVLNATLMLVGVIFAIKYGFSVVGFACLFAISSIITLVYSFVVMRLKFSNSAPASATTTMEMDLGFWKSTIKEALPFFLAAVFSVIAFRIDMVMLSMMKGDVAVGWYSAAFRLIEVLIFIPAVFTAAIYPVISQFHISSQDSLKFAYQKVFKYLCILGVPIAIGTTILADRIILFIFQSGFAQSIIALRVLIWVIPFIFLTYMFGTVLASINRQLLAMKITLLCTVSNVGMNLLLIPRYSYTGAAIATVITGLIAFILYFHFLSKLVSKIQIHKLIVRPVIASGVMAASLFLFSGINLLLLIPVAAIIYFAILLLLKTFSKEDFNLFKRMVV